MTPLDPSETWTDRERRDAQRRRLRAMLTEVLAGDRFYQRKLLAAGVRSADDTLDRWSEMPFTTKDELVADQAEHPPYGTNLTYPLERYVRVHQTSGTTGRPLRILDTADSWRWWTDIWSLIYRAAGVTAADHARSVAPEAGETSAMIAGTRQRARHAATNENEFSRQRQTTSPSRTPAPASAPARPSAVERSSPRVHV
ncbi:MAG: hypothetical protein AAB284_00835 [Chloroflexota bacterium]